MRLQNQYNLFCVKHDTTITFNCWSNFIKHVNYDYIFQSKEYNSILKFYKGKKTKRSNIPYMNHIIEGIYILTKIKASFNTIKAYIIHPIFQSDEDLKTNYELYNDFDSKIILLAMEYRFIANSYLSYRDINGLDEIHLSPLKEVNDMLIADKIQNRKDFLLYHMNHERYFFLFMYFQYWLNRLEITENVYNEMVLEIS
jgi:hypothetical protein